MFARLYDAKYWLVVRGGEILVLAHLSIVQVSLSFGRVGSGKRRVIQVEFPLLDHPGLFFRFSLLQLILINLGGPLELLHDHLGVILLLHYSVTVLRFLVLLVPAPLVDLRLCQTRGLGHSAAGLLRPVWVFLILLHQVLHLIRVLSISLFSIFNLLLVHRTWLIKVVTELLGRLLLIATLVIGSLWHLWPLLSHLNTHLLVILWTKLAYLWTSCCWIIFEIFVSTKNNCLETCLSPLSILVSCCIMDKIVILK